MLRAFGWWRILMVVGLVGWCGGVPGTASASSGAGHRTAPLIWTRMALPDGLAMSSVACPSVRLCVAFDAYGRVAISRSPAVGTSWRRTSGPGYVLGEGPPAAGALRCPSTRLCVGVDPNGDVLTSTNPAGGAWTAQNLDSLGSSPRFSSLSCPSTSLCVAVDSSGNAAVTTDPAGGAGTWRIYQAYNPPAGSCEIPGQNGPPCEVGLQAVACPSTTFCMVGPIHGPLLRSRDPATGTGLWDQTLIGTGEPFLGWLACPSIRMCLVAGNYDPNVYAFDPRAQSPTVAKAEDIDVSQGVWCATATLCFANDGTVLLQSTDPAAGPDAWKTALVPVGPHADQLAVSDLACAGDRLCVAATSADPLVGTAPVPRATVIDTLRGQIAATRRHAHIHVLRHRRSYTLATTAPEPGRLTITWRALLAHHQPIVARGSRQFPSAARATAIRLTPTGRRLIGSRTSIRLRITETFTPGGDSPLTARATIALTSVLAVRPLARQRQHP